MSITVQTIQSLGDDLRRDSTSSAIDANKKLRAVNMTLSQIHSYAHWKFTTRQADIQVFTGDPDYNIVDTLGINDFKDVASLRYRDYGAVKFTNVDPNKFDLLNGKGSAEPLYSVEYRAGDPILRVNTGDVGGTTLVSDTYDHDANGTWTANTSTSDATNVTTDTQYYREGSGSINFDLTVGQSVNNYGEVYVSMSTSSDLSDYLDKASAFMWFDIPAIDSITGVTLFWGSDDSNYWSKSVTTNAQGAALATGWNRLKFDWSSATKTGTPNITAIDYVKVRVSYSASQSSDTDFRINGLRFSLPIDLDLLYYSSYLATNSSGTWIAEPTTTSDIVLIPDRYRHVITEGYTANLFGQMGKQAEEEKHYKRFMSLLKDMSKEFGTYQKTETKAFKPPVRWP